MLGAGKAQEFFNLYSRKGRAAEFSRRPHPSVASRVYTTAGHGESHDARLARPHHHSTAHENAIPISGWGAAPGQQSMHRAAPHSTIQSPRAESDRGPCEALHDMFGSSEKRPPLPFAAPPRPHKVRQTTRHAADKDRMEDKAQSYAKERRHFPSCPKEECTNAQREAAAFPAPDARGHGGQATGQPAEERSNRRTREENTWLAANDHAPRVRKTGQAPR